MRLIVLMLAALSAVVAGVVVASGATTVAAERVTAENPGVSHARAQFARLRYVTPVQYLAQAPQKETGKSAEKKKGTPKKERKAEPVEMRGIDSSAVWRGETEVFSAEQLVRLEPILHASACKDEKVGCLYLENGKPGSEASFTFRLIPWKVSKHRSYLVRNDRCAPGGCDEGLFVFVDGRWRLVIETFGVLERASSMTLGFNDLRFKPRGQAPVRLVWDGQGYREANPAN